MTLSSVGRMTLNGQSYESSLLSNISDININKKSNNNNIGPGSYTPSYDGALPCAPTSRFSTAERFTNKAQVSSKHNTDLLGTEGPGPKYNIVPNSVIYPRASCLGWGSRDDNRVRERKQSFMRLDDNDVGPGQYTIRDSATHVLSPRCTFSHAARFTTNIAASAPPLLPNYDAVQASAPRFSFGPRKEADNKHKPRTSFMTHSIRGGLAKPATLECNIGPGDYTPREPSSARGFGFGSAPRFIKAGVQYLSSEHAKANVGHTGPGPKYAHSRDTTSYQPKSARTQALMWIP